MLRLLALLLALYWLYRRSVCCKSMSLLCRIIINGTVICAGTNCDDVVSSGRNYVNSPSELIALVMQYGGMSVSSVMWNVILIFVSCRWWCTVFGSIFSAWVNGVESRKGVFMAVGLL